MFDPQRWRALVDGTECPVCGPGFAAQAGPATIAELPAGRVVLQDDGDFPGYCVLYARRHVCELPQLDPAEQPAFLAAIVRIAAAVQRICEPLKLNYAILGNEVPHLHCHVIPRYAADGWWGKPIWLRPAAARRPLPPERFAHLLAQLRQALA